MIKKYLIHGILSGVLASILCVGWWKFYSYAAYVNYNEVFGLIQLILIPIVAMIVASIVYGIMENKFGKRGIWVFNILLLGISLISLLGPIKIHLPEEVEFPEFFPAMVLPMHLFPALAWHTLKPLLYKSN